MRARSRWRARRCLRGRRNGAYRSNSEQRDRLVVSVQTKPNRASNGVRYHARKRISRFLTQGTCGGGVPSSHPSLGLSICFLSFFYTRHKETDNSNTHTSLIALSLSKKETRQRREWEERSRGGMKVAARIGEGRLRREIGRGRRRPRMGDG